MSQQMKLCVIGLGYIGLPTASLFATNGFEVVGLEVKEEVVAAINSGTAHIKEPGLSTLVKAAINSGNLRAVLSPEPADVFIIAVPTPLKGNLPDLTFVEQGAISAGQVLERGNLVILESTSPPRTTEDIVRPILERESGLTTGKDFSLAYCPERVLPGSILTELVRNDRIIGGIDEASAQQAWRLYSQVVEGEIFLTDAATAEAAKVMENTYRDVNIALANELAKICHEIGVNAWDVIELANKHPRVNLHLPGPGVGGHCLPVDPWFIVAGNPELAPMIRTARQVNDSMGLEVVKLVTRTAAASSDSDQKRTKKVAVFGVAYKPNVDDYRESPAIPIIRSLMDSGFDVGIFDPYIREFPYEISRLPEAIRNADALLILANHDDFKFLDPKALGELMRRRTVVDTRNCIDREQWQEAGFEILVLGDGTTL